MKQAILTVNIGNTNVSAAICSRGPEDRLLHPHPADGNFVAGLSSVAAESDIRRLASWPTKDWIRRESWTRSEWLQILSQTAAKKVWVSCVVTEVMPVLTDWSLDSDVPVHFATFSSIPLKFDVPAPEFVGIDRLINCTAAWSRFSRTCLVVDLGTAVTWDLVVAPGVFVGGVIAPGLETLAHALPGRTALPYVEPSMTAELIGRDTHACLRSGLWYGFLSSVEGIIDRIHATLPERPLTLLTGGTAQLVAPHLRESYPVLPNLTHEGLRLISTL